MSAEEERGQTGSSLRITVAGEELLLHPARAVFWPRQRLLIIADLHLGKVAHFRKNGIPIPPDGASSNIQQLDILVGIFNPAELLFLGDLTHSWRNHEWDDFLSWRRNYEFLQMCLVRGNHDLLGSHEYEQANVQVVVGSELRPPFSFLHEPPRSSEANLYSMSGHLHPAVTLRGVGRQKLRLPCFLFEETQAVLPAFGSFTGLHSITPPSKSRVFVIVDAMVREINDPIEPEGYNRSASLVEKV